MRFKKQIASFELVLMIASIFAFSYIIGAADPAFQKAREDYESQTGDVESFISQIGKRIFLSLKKPMIPRVSAQGSFFGDNDVSSNIGATNPGTDTEQSNTFVTETDSTYTEEISSTDISAGMGCCSKTVDGNFCMVSSAQNCNPDAIFAEGSTCAQTSVCQKGCCYDSDSGVYDKNVLASLCQKEWSPDPNCNMPGAKMGCCVLGSQTIFETRGQCEIDTYQRALGDDANLDWRGNMNELQCVLLSQNQSEGACVFSGGNCRFVTEGDCLTEGGQFNEGYLCTAVSLNTKCEPTKKTTCVPGKQGVYFEDSCGNIANIYDANKIFEDSYWEKVKPLEESCGASSENGNARSKSCGNCNLILGGYCSNAAADKFSVEYGSNYCKDTSCTFKGETYKTGESWCVYDGVVGDGKDVVGSRHWKYVCNQGTVEIEPCADYRNQICVQSNTFNIAETEVEFRNSACVANNWRQCIDLNTKEDGLEKCVDTLNCKIDEVKIADKFNFDVCVPKYPGGFDLRNERYQNTASKICGQATQTCTVVKASKFMGGCEIVANKGCLKETFAREMNDWCTSLGDCGMEVNIAGEFNEDNYRVKKSKKLSDAWLRTLAGLADPIPGQYAEVEDYQDYLDAAGLNGAQVNPGEGSDSESFLGTDHALGVIGIGYAVGAIVTQSVALQGLGAAASQLSASFVGPLAEGASATAGFAAFAGAAIGAGIGMMAGIYIAKSMGLSPLGTTLMAVGGAAIGGAIGYSAFVNGLAATFTAMGPIGWAILIIGAIIMVIASFFGGSDCDNIKVEFECKAWQPPVGGDDCELCNEDPLKVCSEYRCQSLGASCELLNKGTGEEVCVDAKRDDTQAPIIGPQTEAISETEVYSEVTEGGFSITSTEGECLEAYAPLVFGITTDEPSQCRFDVTQKDFGEMDYDMGGTSYTYNHTTLFTLPDPSHGQSQGLDFNGELRLYVKCRDSKGHVNPSFYTIDMCVNQGPDKQGPIVRATEPAKGTMVSSNTTAKNISIITNELSTCRWGPQDNSYASMTNEMACDTSLVAPSSPIGYRCFTEVPVEGIENKYYIRCKDQPWLIGVEDEARNEGKYTFSLVKPEKKIEIDWIEPSQDYEVGTERTTMEIQAKTSGGSDVHHCSYSFSGYDKMILMFNSGSRGEHSQPPINRPTGKQKIYIECEDYYTGEIVRDISEFEVIYDTAKPQIARIWQDGGILNFITTERSECKFSTKSCRFKWNDAKDAGSGYEHDISVVKGNTYFIKCRDEFGNVPTDCSIRARTI